jgi:hypothetical protein
MINKCFKLIGAGAVAAALSGCYTHVKVGNASYTNIGFEKKVAGVSFKGTNGETLTIDGAESSGKIAADAAVRGLELGLGAAAKAAVAK